MMSTISLKNFDSFSNSILIIILLEISTFKILQLNEQNVLIFFIKKGLLFEKQNEMNILNQL